MDQWAGRQSSGNQCCSIEKKKNEWNEMKTLVRLSADFSAEIAGWKGVAQYIYSE